MKEIVKRVVKEKDHQSRRNEEAECRCHETAQSEGLARLRLFNAKTYTAIVGIEERAVSVFGKRARRPVPAMSTDGSLPIVRFCSLHSRCVSHVVGCTSHCLLLGILIVRS